MGENTTNGRVGDNDGAFTYLGCVEDKWDGKSGWEG